MPSSSSSLSVYCLSAILGGEARPWLSAAQITEFPLVAHFYMRAENDVSAGAMAHDWCRLEGLEFKEYICLPNPIAREQIQNNEEHIRAFELAQCEGGAVVVSAVLSGLPQWIRHE